MTRMWNIPPEYLCRNHFLGEHNELHKIVGSLNAGRSVQGYLDKGQIEVHNIRARHEELVQEFENRGWNHRSPLPEFEVFEAGSINIEDNIKELIGRCPRCKERILKCVHGGTGLHEGLKIPWGYPLAGSSPAGRTKRN